MFIFSTSTSFVIYCKTLKNCKILTIFLFLYNFFFKLKSNCSNNTKCICSLLFVYSLTNIKFFFKIFNSVTWFSIKFWCFSLQEKDTWTGKNLLFLNKIDTELKYKL